MSHPSSTGRSRESNKLEKLLCHRMPSSSPGLGQRKYAASASFQYSTNHVLSTGIREASRVWWCSWMRLHDMFKLVPYNHRVAR